MDDNRIWGVRAGDAGQADGLFLEHAQLALGFCEAGGDVSGLPPSRGAFREAFARGAPDARPGAAPVQAGQLYRFVHEMRIGQRVIYPRKIDRTLHWGEIVGPYVYERDNGPEFAHRRAVRWMDRRSRDDFSPGALYEIGATLTLFEVKSFASEFRRKFERGAEAGDEECDESAPRDVAESTNDFIARRLRAQFKGFPLEEFVADLFRAMGYRARVTRRTRDDGIDVIAHRDELGIEPPILNIQVKAQDANIGADVVKAFYAMVHDRDVAIFITTGGYTASATDFARTRANLKLMTGVELFGLVQKYYDGLSWRHRQEIPLRRVLVPDAAPDGRP